MPGILIGLLPGTRQTIPVGQEMIIFSAPQGVRGGPEMITFSAPQGVPEGQEMITFSCPAGTRPQDITTRLKRCNSQYFLLLPRTKQRY